MKETHLANAIDLLTFAYVKMSETISLDHLNHPDSCEDRMCDANHERLHDILRHLSYAIIALTGEPVQDHPRIQNYINKTAQTYHVANPHLHREDHE